MARPGKKITSFDFNDRQGLRLNIPVRQYPHRDGKVELYVDLPEYDIYEKGSDIEALRATVFAALRGKAEIAWERFYAVEIQCEPAVLDGDPDDAGTGIIGSQHLTSRIEVSTLEIGTGKDGQKYWRPNAQRSLNNGLPPEGQIVKYDDLHVDRLLPFTPENAVVINTLLRQFYQRAHAFAVESLVSPQPKPKKKAR